MKRVAHAPPKGKSTKPRDPVGDARAALQTKAAAERLERIAGRASDLLEMARDMRGGNPVCNLAAVCTAALVEALDGVARSRS